ncbi:beta-lactamase/transpeptidase-like protein [Crassisporium funariophilum]|nr:beta-lactamase/transpeptidase-like protein [Crassisporium funariophilum]
MVALTASGKKALDNLVERVVKENNIPGFVLGAAAVDGEVYFRGGGSNVVGDPASGDVNEDSVFWICSQTKLIAHLAGLKLVEQGKISFETPVSDYIPEFANPVIVDDVTSDKPSFKPAKTVIRMKHLFNFSSGLFYPVNRPTPYSLPDAYTAAHDKQDYISEFYRIITGDLPGLPIKFEPGTDFVYGWSSDTIGFVVEKVCGMTLEEYCKENIFKPLGMTSSFYLTPELESKLVGLTFRRDGKLEPWADHTKLIERDPSKVMRHLGGVGLYSSLKDYLTLLRHLLHMRLYHLMPGNATNPILKVETVRDLFVGTLTEEGSKSLDLFTAHYTGLQWSTGLAVTADDWPKRRRKGSAFWSGWAGTYGFIDPKTGVAAVFGTQIVPSRDAEILKLYAEFEETLYAGLQ